MIEYEFYPQCTDNIKRVYGGAVVYSTSAGMEDGESLDYELISPTVVFEDDISVPLDEEDILSLLDQQDMEALEDVIWQAHLSEGE